MTAGRVEFQAQAAALVVVGQAPVAVLAAVVRESVRVERAVLPALPAASGAARWVPLQEPASRELASVHPAAVVLPVGARDRAEALEKVPGAVVP